MIMMDDFCEESSPVYIANQTLLFLRQNKEEILSSVELLRTENDKLEKTLFNKKQRLSVANEKLGTNEILSLDEEKKELIAQIKDTENNVLCVEENLSYEGSELQKECIEFNSAIAEMQLEYQNVDLPLSQDEDEAKDEELQKQIRELEETLSLLKQKLIGHFDYNSLPSETFDSIRN